MRDTQFPRVELKSSAPFHMKKLFLDEYLKSYLQIKFPLIPKSQPKCFNFHRCSGFRKIIVINLGNYSSTDFNKLSNIDFDVFPCKIVNPTSYGFTIEEELFSVPLSFIKDNYAEHIRKNCPFNSVFTSKKDDPNDCGLLADQIINKVLEPPDAKKGRTEVTYSELFPFPDPLTPDKISRTSLLLNFDQMVQEKIPVPSYFRKAEETTFKPSLDVYEPVSDKSPLFGIDCEMVFTKKGNELARVTIVDQLGLPLLDKYVKPPNPVLNYLTQYSGITKQSLANVTTTLDDIREDIKKILPPDAILCGHSIGGDLSSIKIFHPYVIDSSCIYNSKGRRPMKSKLKYFTKLFLNENIQCGSGGHSSSEDAKASLDLITLKLNNSLEFGDICSGWKFPDILNKIEDEISLEDSQNSCDVKNFLFNLVKANGPFDDEDVESYIYNRRVDILSFKKLSVVHFTEDILKVNKIAYDIDSSVGIDQLSTTVNEKVKTNDFLYARVQVDDSLSEKKRKELFHNPETHKQVASQVREILGNLPLYSVVFLIHDVQHTLMRGTVVFKKR